jgi:alpha-tubulin suppressor-like RCC1 family protein
MSLRYTGAWLQDGAFDPLAPPTPFVGPYLYSWGRNSSGQLGLGNRTDYSSPVQVGSLANWDKISVSSGALATKTDGTLWSWGNGDIGRLGLGNTTSYSSPKQVGALTNWLRISTCYRSSFSIKTDGTMWSWGNGSTYGILGLGNTTSYSSPKQVGSLTGWLQVSNAYAHTGAVRTNGTLWMWGRNTQGTLGLGNTTDYSSPKQVGALTNWLQVSTNYATLAIKTDGTLWSWGYNVDGALGLGDRTDRSSPVQVGALTNWAYVNVRGANRVLAIKTDGTLWAWGGNASGVLGLGNTTSYSSPKQVGSLTNWSKLEVSDSFSANFCLAIKTDKTLWAWGNGANGRLGLGNTTSYSSPKQVGGLTDWLNVAAGYFGASLATR